MSTSHQTLITTAGTADSPDRNDCPSVHTLPGRDEAFVVVRDDVDDTARAELAAEYNPKRELLGTQPRWVPCGLMDLATLGRFMDDNVHQRGDWRFRLEQLPAYSRAGTDFRAWRAGDAPPTAKQEWLDQLERDVAAGIAHYRVRILSEDLTDYELYACQRGYALNSAFEQIRVLRRGEHSIPSLLGTGDYWVVNRIIVPVIYQADGTFVGGAYIGAADERAEAYRDDARRLWDAAEAWASWWSRHPEYHGARPSRAA